MIDQESIKQYVKDSVGLVQNYDFKSGENYLTQFRLKTDQTSNDEYANFICKPVEDIRNNWGPREPNNAFGGDGCALIRRYFNTSGGTDLNDESYGFLQPSICKKILASLDCNRASDICDRNNKFSAHDGKHENVFFRKDYRFYESKQSFYKFHTQHRSWLGSKKRCAREGAFLWYPEDQEEVDLMAEYWKEKQPGGQRLHVGVSDLLSEGQWETVDGKPVEDIWNKWAPGEPNNAFGGEDCAVFRVGIDTPGGTDLIDENCSYVQPFICKKTLASVEWNNLCHMPEKRYIFDEKLGRCYKFQSKPLSWNEAYSVCSAEESYLAVINSETEKDFLVKMIADAHTEKITGDFFRQVHLGFHNRFDEGWQTVTGTSLDESGYAVWAKGQPDGGDKEQCGTMLFDGVYNDIGCNERAFFICEHDIRSLTNALDERILKGKQD